MRLPLALAVLVLLAPARALAQSCSAESVSNSALKAQCGTAGSSGPCQQYVNAVIDNCDKDLNSVADLFLALKKKPELSKEEEREYQRLHSEMFAIMEMQRVLSDNATMGAKKEPIELPGLDLQNFNERYMTRIGDFTQHLGPPVDSPLNEFLTTPETPTGLDSPLPEKFGVPTKASPPEKIVPGGLPIETQVAAQLEKHPPVSPAADLKLKTQAGKLYLAGGDTRGAERVGAELAKSAPKDAAGPVILAQAALRGGKTQDASDWARKALAIDPKNKDARQALGYAEAVLSKSRLKGPGAAPGFDEKASAGPAAAAAAGAQAAAAGGVPRVPEGSVPALGGATGAGLPGSAPLAPPPHLKIAHRKALLGDYAGALADLTLALDQNPEDDTARLMRAEISNAMLNPAAALADVERVLDRNPSDARGWRAKADALLQLGRLEEALAAVERALKLDAGSAAGHLLRAQILEKIGRVDDAVAEYREAARLDPALTPVAEEAVRRLGRGGEAAEVDAAVRRKLVRGGAIALSLLLVLAGLVGGVRVATRRSRAVYSSAPSTGGSDRTVGRGDTVAGQYVITRELGRGGMGVVFEALDERLKRPVALKQMQSDFRSAPEDAARFLQEARLVAQLKHPNVAEIYAAVDDGGLFLVFELIEGKSLDRALEEGALETGEARRIVADLCSALSAAHARRIIHRDLKPSNVMLAADGSAKIMDFGIAHQSRTSSGSTQTSASGTPPYMAPEQAMGSVLPASDLYALAVMTYELLCGRRPFLGPDFLGPKMRGEFLPITRQRPALPAGLDAFFSAALSPDPSRRPPDAQAFRKELERCWDAAMPRTVV